MSLISAFVPEPKKGSELNFFHQREFLTEAAAHAQFQIAGICLLHLLCWRKLTGNDGTLFFLFDENERLLNRPAAQGDFIRMGKNGLLNKNGRGFEWLHIEALVEEPHALAMCIRHCAAPGASYNGIGGIQEACTIGLWQDRTKMGAAILCQIDLSGLQTPLLENLKSAALAATAEAGQEPWISLAKGLIEN